MKKKPDRINIDSTPHASPACSDADQAGSCFSRAKDPLTNEQLAQRLIDKGLQGASVESLSAALSTKGYYRLKGYWLTLERNGRFKRGASFDDVLEIERFNSDISLFLFELIAPIEICLRAQMIEALANEYGPRALHEPAAFENERDFQAMQRSIARETDQALRSKKPLAVRNMEKYGQLPIWAEVENASFGTLSKAFGNLANKSIASNIASSFGVAWPHLKNWLRHLTQIRNICAHHDRLYNKMFTVRPRLFSEHRSLGAQRLLSTFIVLFRMLESLDPALANLSRRRLGRIADAHPTVDLAPIGFTNNWREVLRIPEPEAHDYVRPRGRKGGRPLKDAAAIEQALYLYDMHELSVAQIAKHCGMSLSTLYKYINQRKDAAGEGYDYAVVPFDDARST